MRAAEWINLVTFPCFMALAWVRPSLGARRRRKITAIGLGGAGLTLLGAFVLPRVVTPLAASVVRDWLPYLLLLMFYWQAGGFVTRVDHGFQNRLIRWDERFVTPILRWCSCQPVGCAALTVLELAYLFCYISMPLGLAALYLMRLGHEAARFWAAVLPATYFCYAMLPFLQTQPPRVLEKMLQPPRGNIRALNLWILGWGSIHANTCPSAHVASTMACAFVLVGLAPQVGVWFLLAAVLIALGTVFGRYHYGADAVLGTTAALVSYGISGVM
jgi:hypothetical protein